MAEWNDKPTFVTRAQKQAGYDALFKIAKFSTVFGYATIDIDGDIAIVRTFHHKGATVLENACAEVAICWPRQQATEWRI